MPRYSVGDAVMLGAWEDTPRTAGFVLSVDECSWGVSYVVRVLPEYAGDDGLRELTEDQIEGPIGRPGRVYH